MKSFCFVSVLFASIRPATAKHAQPDDGPGTLSKAAGSAHVEPAWTATDTALVGNVHLLDLVNGSIPIPSNITNVVIEIGCNGHELQWNEPLDLQGLEAPPGILPNVRIRDQPNVLLLSFEPLLDKYAIYLSMLKSQGSEPKYNEVGEKKYNEWRLYMEQAPSVGWSVPGRAIVLPFAVGMPDGGADFHISLQDGCSSLGEIDPASAKGEMAEMVRKGWGCGVLHSTRRVPMVSLETIVNRWLRHMPEVSYIKVDAQGFDLLVAQSVGAAAPRVRLFKMEMTPDSSSLPTKGAVNCSGMVAGMQSLGYRTRSSCSKDSIRQWTDFIFTPRPRLHRSRPVDA